MLRKRRKRQDEVLDPWWTLDLLIGLTFINAVRKFINRVRGVVRRALYGPED